MREANNAVLRMCMYHGVLACVCAHACVCVLC